MTIDEEISDEIVNEHDWNDEELETAFGEVLPLYHCFEEGGGNVESKEFWEVLAELIPEIKSDGFSSQISGAMISWEATAYFAENPEQVKKRAKSLLQELKEGYNRLAELLPEK